MLWAQSAGSTSFDEGFAIDTDAAANVYVGGEVWASAAFGSGTVTAALPPGAFVAKFAPDGSLTWVRGEADLFGVGDLAVDSAGNAYVTGALSRSIAVRGWRRHGDAHPAVVGGRRVPRCLRTGGGSGVGT